jgi:putative SOS response-associated peptidase YedK
VWAITKSAKQRSIKALFVYPTQHIELRQGARDLQVEGRLINTGQRTDIRVMCGRVIQSSGPLHYAIVDGLNVRDSRTHNYPPRWNGAPSQELLVIRRNHKTGEVSLDPLRWGLIPYWCKDPAGGRKPINAKCETVRTLQTFRDAYRFRRCILPVDGFYEWKAIKGQRAKQPYAIAMKDGSPFGIAGIWENWKDPRQASGSRKGARGSFTPEFERGSAIAQTARQRSGS